MEKMIPTEKLRICFIAPKPPPYGGIANWYNTISNYAKSQTNIECININIAPSSRTTEGRTIFNRVIISGLQILSKIRELYLILNKHNINIVHMTTSGQLALFRDIILLKLCKMKNIPSVYHLHFGRLPEIAIKNNIEWKLAKIAIKLSAHTIVLDRPSLKSITSKLPEVNVSCIGNPFDISILNSLRYTKKNTSIVFVGWVIQSKGIEDILLAWENLSSHFKDYSLKIIGPYKQQYFEQLSQRYSLERVNFTGELDHQNTLQAIADASILLLPSHTEGFPNVILEAMAVKTSIIASNVGAIPDILSDNCGICIKPKDTKQLTNAIEACITSSELCAKYAENAYEKLHNQYELSNIFGKYQAIWRHLTI